VPNRQNRLRDDVPSVVTELNDAFGLDQTGVNGQREPILRFVRFLFNDTHLSDEFSARTCTASGAIICANRGTGSHQLIANNPSRTSIREFIYEPNDR